MSADRSPGGEELPDDLADLAAERLLALEVAQRGPALAALVAEHPEHATGLARLAEALAGVDRLLGGAAVPAPGELPQLPGYRIERRLGSGSFGDVFLGTQERPVVRQVAIKVLRAGLGDEQTLRRFEAERQVLATLNHASITQVFDAGTLTDGRPWFVMEFVDGLPFRRFCAERLDTHAERLRLFAQLCRGVAHAHRRGIVHRDLKPANVLVVDSDAGPLPKIIDFGIAKATLRAPGSDGPHTDAGRVIGTPGYMSPEQAAGRSHTIDERADVFALGVMLYELLTGELPWSEGASATDTEPVRPSARAAKGSSGARRAAAAGLRGELDWITLRAIARERGERYASATQLAEDVERYLRGEPVSVGPPSLGYRLRKFARRNRASVVLASVAVMLAVGLAIAIRVGSSAALAGREAADQAVAALLARANDPRLQETPRGDAMRQALLEDALSFYERFLASRPDDPSLRAGRCRSLLAIAQVQRLLGDPARAGAAAADALTEVRSLCADVPADADRRALLADALLEAGRDHAAASNHAAAEALFAESAATWAACATQAPLERGRARIVALREAATTHDVHDRPTRIAGLRAVLAEFAALAAPGTDALLDRERIDTDIALGNELIATDEQEAADAVLRDAEGLLNRPGTGSEQQRCQVARGRGRAAWNRNERTAAVEHMRAAIAAAEAWRQREPERLAPLEAAAGTLRDLGWFLNYMDDFDGSDRALQDALARGEAMLVAFPTNPSCLTSLCRALVDTAYLLRDRFRRQDLDAAAAAANRALELCARFPGTVDVGAPPRWQILALCAGLEDARRSGGDGELWRRVEAELPADEAQRTRQWQRHLIQADLGLANWHLAHGEREATARCLVNAEEGIRRDHPDSDKLLVETGWCAARLAAAAGDHAGAAAAAARILAARPTWFGQQRTGDALRLAWLCTQRAAPPDRALGEDYRTRAAACFQQVLDSLRNDVEKSPDDPFYVLPWADAAVRRAELAAAAGEAGDHRALLTKALERLAAVRTRCHADLWDEAVFADGQALAARLATADQHR